MKFVAICPIRLVGRGKVASATLGFMVVVYPRQRGIGLYIGFLTPGGKSFATAEVASG